MCNVFIDVHVDSLKMFFINQSLLFLHISFVMALCFTRSFIMPAVENITEHSLLFPLLWVCMCVKAVTLISDISPDIFLPVGMSCYKFCIQLHGLMVFALLVSIM